jgi:hypothetical protein
MAAPYGMAGPQGPKVRFDAIGEAWRLFSAQMGVWIPSLLVVLVISLALSIGLSLLVGMAFGLGTFWAPKQAVGFSLMAIIGQMAASLISGVFTYALTGGLFKMAIRQSRGETIQVGDIFGALDRALPLIGAYLLTTILIYVGMLFCVLPGLILAGLFMFVVPLIVDQNMGVIRAIETSFNTLKSDWLMAALFYLVIAIVAGLGAIACGIGLLFTVPLFFLGIALVYRDFFYGTPAAAYGAAAPPGYGPQPPAGAPPAGYGPQTPPAPNEPPTPPSG